MHRVRELAKGVEADRLRTLFLGERLIPSNGDALDTSALSALRVGLAERIEGISE